MRLSSVSRFLAAKQQLASPFQSIAPASEEFSRLFASASLESTEHLYLIIARSLQQRLMHDSHSSSFQWSRAYLCLRPAGSYFATRALSSYSWAGRWTSGLAGSPVSFPLGLSYLWLMKERLLAKVLCRHQRCAPDWLDRLRLAEWSKHCVEDLLAVLDQHRGVFFQRIKTIQTQLVQAWLSVCLIIGHKRRSDSFFLGILRAVQALLGGKRWRAC